MSAQEAYRETLREHDLSVTRLRLALMEALHEGRSAVTAGELLERLRRDDHTLHRTTVYRNLAALEEAGLVRSVPSGGRAVAYELNCDHRPPVHPHFTCRSCGRLTCLEPVDLDSVWGLLTQDSGLHPERAEVTLVGLCGECAEGSEQ